MIERGAPRSRATFKALATYMAEPGLIGPSISIIKTSLPAEASAGTPKINMPRQKIPIEIMQRKPTKRFLGIFFDLQAQTRHDFLNILPYLTLCRGIPQEVSGVECGHECNAHVRIPFPSPRSNPEIFSEKALTGHPAKGTNDRRFDDIKLPF
jgi:hypothetical protein